MVSPSVASSASDDGIRFIAIFDAKLQVYSPKYTFLLSYILTTCVLFFFSAVDEYFNWPEDAFLAWILCIARGFGHVLNFNIALIFLLASKKTLGLLRNTVIGAVLPIDEAMPELHSFIGYVSFVSAVIHGTFHYIAALGRNLWAPGFGKWTWCIVSGFIVLALFGTIVATAMRPMRKRNFEAFIRAHLVGATLFIPLICLHGFYNGKLYSFKWILGPAIIYVLDKCLRKWSEHQASVRIHVDSAYRNMVYGGDIVRLSFPKTFQYRAGQFAELCIPVISKSQWHPFTIASAPHEDEIVFFIKQLGDWTSALQQLCKLGVDPKSGRSMLSFDVKIRGPYGSPAQHVGQYDKILLIAGGVGSTPFCSITKSLTEAISRQCFHETVRRDRSNSSLSTVASSTEEMDQIEQQNTSPSWDHPNISDIGITFDFGIHRPRRPLAGARQEVFKHPTLALNRDRKDDMSPVPTQTWVQFLYTLACTTLFNTVMIWLLLIRLTICLLGVAFLEVDWDAKGTDIFDSTALTCVDLILSVVSLSLLLLSVTCELVAEGRTFIEDILLLIPLSSLPVVLHSISFSGRGHDIGYFAQNYFYIGWPLLVVLTVFRFFRVLGRRAFLADTVRRSHQTTRSVDFIWTTPTREDDKWLVDELSRSVGKSLFVRLHRFITRETGPDVESGEISPEDSGNVANMFRGRDAICADHYGQPNWNQIFEQFTSKMRNGSTTGIFFCGPPKLAAAVKEAAMASMLDSRYRSLSNKVEKKRGPGLDSLLFSQGKSNNVPDSLTRSFNVRYVFREEKF